MIGLARNMLRVVGAVTDLVQPPKALLTDPGFRAAQLNEVEAANDGLDGECDLCRSLTEEHGPGLVAISCGTPGCPNASYPSAPGLGGLVERTTPEVGHPRPASGASTSITSGGGKASVGNQPLPGAVATPGAGQPLSQVLLFAAGFASAGGAPVWICQAVMDLADQFRADELDAL